MFRHRTVIINLTLVTRVAILINVRSRYGPNRTGKGNVEKKGVFTPSKRRVVIALQSFDFRQAASQPSTLVLLRFHFDVT